MPEAFAKAQAFAICFGIGLMRPITSRQKSQVLPWPLCDTTSEKCQQSNQKFTALHVLGVDSSPALSELCQVHSGDILQDCEKCLAEREESANPNRPTDQRWRVRHLQVPKAEQLPSEQLVMTTILESHNISQPKRGRIGPLKGLDFGVRWVDRALFPLPFKALGYGCAMVPWRYKDKQSELVETFPQMAKCQSCGTRNWCWKHYLSIYKWTQRHFS